MYSKLNFKVELAGAGLRIALRVIYWIFAIVIIVVGGLAWWFVYRPLPQIDGSASLPGLQSYVTVDRDRWGVPHITAKSVTDMAEAQGYVMAQDRLWQMDLLRRVGRGQLSEIFGPAALRVDRQFRTYGFARAADRDATLLGAEQRVILEAFAVGVNKFVEQHENSLPIEFSLLKYKPQPWHSSDTLVISAYMYESLTETWEDKLKRAKVTERVGAERAKELFSEEAAMDHFVVGDPATANDGSQHSRAGTDDEDDDDDMEPDTVLKANRGVSAEPNIVESYPDLTSALWPSVENFLQGTRRDIRHGLGSNNWVVSGAHTATGKPLLANDTHLELTVPPIWYEVHITAPGWNVKGFTLPGAPLVIIGHNDQIAWGFTNNGADVQDLYIENFNPGAADEYRANGSWVKAQLLDEIIHVKGQADEHFKVVLTRHGPVVAHDGDKAYALRWTATEPGALANSYNMMGKARNWDEFLGLMKRVWGPAQNAVYADTSGNIGYVVAARIPVRKKGHGEMPVPGDTDDYEWTGYIPFEQLPQALNPESGLIVTANARVVGPNYKPYLTDRWEEPYRTARIYDLLRDKQELRPEDMLKVQTDTYSYPHVFLAEQLTAADKIAKPKDARTQKLIERLKDWNGIADASSVETPFLQALRLTTLRNLLEPLMGKDTGLYEWRSTAFLQKILTEKPVKWLPAKFKNYDELLIAAADEAVLKLASDSGSKNAADWTWTRFNALDMLHPIGREGILKKLLSITNKPQSGTQYSVRAATRHHGPSMRLVANTANWDNSIMVIPAGQSGQPGSSHYSDQFSYWFDGKPIFAPFSAPASAAATRHTLTLKPAN